MTWRMAADDFRTQPNTPVTGVQWWGAYEAWNGLEPPTVAPNSWRIGFWTNAPADSRHAFARPNKLLWLVDVQASRVEETAAGLCDFVDGPSETCFGYALTLEPYECFWYNDLVDAEEETVWITIAAVYGGPTEPEYPWGWQSRPQPWGNGAVTLSTRRDDLRAGMEIDSDVDVEVVANSLLCERLDTYDMAFELETDPAYLAWEQSVTGARDWEYYEDEESVATTAAASAQKWDQAPDLDGSGIAVDITDDTPTTWPALIAADDFQCSTTGAITDITLWGAWYNDVLPGDDETDVTFMLSIRSDISSSKGGPGGNRPGEVLWSKEFKPGAFGVEPVNTRTQGFYCPANATFAEENHRGIYKYSFEIDAAEAFEQQGSSKSPVVYWLCVQADLVHSPGNIATRFGWLASTDLWNGSAVWARGHEPYNGSWDELAYPKGHGSNGSPLDLAFEIETETEGAGSNLRYYRLVADDWQSNGQDVVTGLIWWGSYIGYGYQVCQCQQAEAPKRPDYFLLSIWTDEAAIDSAGYGHPGQKVWEVRAEDFEEVLVGFDQYAGTSDGDLVDIEPVYRYTVVLPEDDWFCPDNGQAVYWLSIAAVFEDTETATYSWGWTNHINEPWGLPESEALAHWQFDETTGGTAADGTGNGNTGALMGDPQWRPDSGWYDGAIDLDGHGDYVRVANPVGLDFAPDSFSASAWVYPRQTRKGYQAIMEYDRGSTHGNRFGLWIDPQGRFHFRVGLNTWHSSQSLEPEQWSLLTATYNGDTHEMMIYVNGVLDAVAINSKGFAAPVDATLTIGVRGDEKNEFFNGYLDEVWVFGTMLGDDDVLTLLGIGRNEPAVEGWIDAGGVWQWAELRDQTGVVADASFILVTSAQSCTNAGAGDKAKGGEAEVEVKTTADDVKAGSTELPSKEDTSTDTTGKDTTTKDAGTKESSSKDSTDSTSKEATATKETTPTKSSSKEDSTTTQKK